jgi:glucose-1-phosphate cytidylyltransferase
MKTVILAGGLGSRLAEETVLRPKPMVEIGGKPILWHIMSLFGARGFNEFVVALGYRGEMIKDYFLNHFLYNCDLTIDLKSGETKAVGSSAPNWRVHLVDTGLNTFTGGRIKRLKPWLGNETFMATYGDGLCNVDLKALVAFHKQHGRLATVTAVRPPSRFGALVFDGSRVVSFIEKPQGQMHEGWINGGFFVLEPGVFDYIDGDQSVWERDPLERLVADGQLEVFPHEGFFQPMDTIRDRQQLEALWASGSPPWIFRD